MAKRFDIKYAQFIRFFLIEDIQKVTLGSLCIEEPSYGTSATAIKRIDETQPKYIRITDFDDFGIESNHIYMTTNDFSKQHILKKDDLIFARTGATVGKTYYYDGTIGDAVFAGYCIRFRFDKNKVLPKYVYWYTKTNDYLTWVKSIQRPSGQPNINKEEYKSFEIILPSIPQQQRLISYMDEAAKKRVHSLNQANELLSNIDEFILKSLGLSISHDKSLWLYGTTLSKINGRVDADYYSPRFVHFRNQIENSSYGATYLGDVCENMTSGFAAGKQDQADELPDNQRVPQLRPFSITPHGQLSFETRKFVPISGLKCEDYCKKHEVLFNNTNSAEWVGKTTVFDVDIPCVTSNHITRITLKPGINPYYITAFFNALRGIGYWKLLSTYFNNQAGINNETLQSIRIPIPDICIQDKIAQEIQRRQEEAGKLKKEAELEWVNAKTKFEEELLQGNH